jgi:hypothetical protein
MGSSVGSVLIKAQVLTDPINPRLVWPFGLAGAALCTETARNRLLAAAIATIFVTFPDGRGRRQSPFLALANVASTNASSRFNWPLSCKCRTSSRSACSSFPLRTHCWNRRWQVWKGRYFSGSSRHCSCAQDPLHTMQHGTCVVPRTTALIGMAHGPQHRLYRFPLFVGQFPTATHRYIRRSPERLQFSAQWPDIQEKAHALKRAPNHLA